MAGGAHILRQAAVRTAAWRIPPPGTKASYHFGTKEYVACFETPAPVDGCKFRAAAVKYVKNFDPAAWGDRDPIRTVVAGRVYQGGEVVDTVDAAGKVNGRQVLADSEALAAVTDFMRSHTAAAATPRPLSSLILPTDAVRRVERVFLSEGHAAALIGNQAMDFVKQDGVTEIEESIQANAVERKLTDKLLADEARGAVQILRYPALVSCVSNFTNFLDLFRKTLRNLEAGVPVLVLSRSNTSQHCYRWFQALQKLTDAEGIPASMLAFASTSVEQQRAIMLQSPMSPTYFTGSREVARLIKEVSPRAISSTGGPNTLISVAATPQVLQAARDSASIENAGQCTALRHLVLPFEGQESSSEALGKRLFAGSTKSASALESLEESKFAALLPMPSPGASSRKSLGYTSDPAMPVSLKVSKSLPGSVDEYWREVVVDVTTPGTPAEMEADAFIDPLCAWVRAEQPISVAVNGSMELARRVWERTGQVVFTRGTVLQPAMTCQARPQDGEVFGELPPRASLLEHTRFPVVVPTPSAGYNARYSLAFLEEQGAAPLPSLPAGEYIKGVESKAVRGFCLEILNFVRDACAGPFEGVGHRTTLFGVQRPPLGQGVAVRIARDATYDQAAPLLLPFLATNAAPQLHISVHPASPAAVTLATLGLAHQTEEDAAFEKRAAEAGLTHVVRVPCRGGDLEGEYPLAGLFVSRLLTFGHCKSVIPDDKEFLNVFRASDKWLKLRA